MDRSRVAYTQAMRVARPALSQKNYRLAIEFANQALKSKPDDAEALKILGAARSAQNPSEKK
jgi:Flp pilus assembly protein TadD